MHGHTCAVLRHGFASDGAAPVKPNVARNAPRFVFVSARAFSGKFLESHARRGVRAN